MTTFDTTLPNPRTMPDIYADIPVKRGLAWLIDMTLIAIFCVLVLPFTAFTGIFFFPLMMLIIGFLYRWSTLASGSSTWGMRLMAVEFRDSQGYRLQSGTAFLHTLGYTISVAVAPLQLISIIMMLVSERKQGLTDHLLGTVAINRPY